MSSHDTPYQAWKRKIRDAEAKRDAEWSSVWKPLYDGLLGGLLRNQAEMAPEKVEATNGLTQFRDVVMPLFIGDDRKANVQVRLGRPGEDMQAKQQFADMLADQATAVAHAVGCYRDQLGRQGHFAEAVSDALWGMGVLVFGFETPRGVAPHGDNEADEYAQGENAGDDDYDDLFPEIDIDRAVADNNELSDPGMPWCRSYSPRRCAFDTTFNDVRRSRFATIEIYMTVDQAKARWPQYKDKWTKTSSSVPEIPSRETSTDQTKAGDGCGVIGFWHVYAVDPLREFIVPFETSGVAEILDERPLDLGIEGLPILLLGGHWHRDRLYPEPIAARVYGAAQYEIEAVETDRAALRQVKNALFVTDETLAKQIRKGDDNAVYTMPPELKDRPLGEVVKTIELGGARKEQVDAQARARECLERNGGINDLQLGRREPGNPTVPEVQTRQAAISSRLNGLLTPVRAFESSMFNRLIAIIYQKIDLLNGLQLPLDDGARFAVIDANHPMVGELIDYTFTVDVRDRLNDADVSEAAQRLLGLFSQIAPLLQQQGTTPNFAELAEQVAMRSGLPQSDRLIMPFQPPPPQPDPNAQQPAQQPQPGTEAAEGEPAQQPPQAEAQEQQADPQEELRQLYAALQQVPEGSPQEDQILAAIAQLQNGLQPAAAA